MNMALRHEEKKTLSKVQPFTILTADFAQGPHRTSGDLAHSLFARQRLGSRGVARARLAAAGQRETGDGKRARAERERERGGRMNGRTHHTAGSRGRVHFRRRRRRFLHFVVGECPIPALS